MLLVCAWTPLYAADLININTADRAMLTELYGIGEVKAQAIIDYRTYNGPFRKVEDIMQVKGIGTVTFAAIKEQITVGSVEPLPPSAPVVSPAPPRSAPASSAVETSPPLPLTEPKQKVQQEAAVFTSREMPQAESTVMAYALGLVAIIVLGVAAVFYARTSEMQRATFSSADEFEIINE